MNSNDISKALKIIIDFYSLTVKEELDEREQSILKGSLENLTYIEMKQRYSNLTYAVEYISRNLGYSLWRKLTSAAHESSFFKNNYQVSKKRIWHFVEHLDRLQKQGEFQRKNPSEVIEIPPMILEGEVLCDRFAIEEHLFDRNQGERQFLAFDLHLNKKPCLVLQRSHQTPRVKRQFVREGNILSQIGKHAQIPQLLGYFTEQQHLYLVYEYISGTGLAELLTEEPWSESQVKCLLKSLLTVLDFIQQHNLIHRNLNPSNIIQANKDWILTDFATVKELVYDNGSITRNTLAQEDLSYLAPEQRAGMAIFASDVYSIGMIAVHALTGIHPRKLRIDPQTGNRIWRNHVSVSESLAQTIDGAISYHFRDRYQSAAEMLKSLGDFAVI